MRALIRKLFARPHEIQKFIDKVRTHRVDRIHFRHMTVLRHHRCSRAPVRPLAGGLLQQIELFLFCIHFKLISRQPPPTWPQPGSKLSG